jgi:hypothetical protein
MTVLHDAKLADFNYLRIATGLTRGNFSAHMANFPLTGITHRRRCWPGVRPVAFL